MHADDETILRDLVKTVAALYRSDAGDPGAAAALARALDALQAADFAPAAPRVLPASGLLLSALDSMADSRLWPLAASIRAAQPLFRWRQNPNYNAGNIGEAFVAGYGYVEFIGPKESLFRCDAVRVGLLLLGPGLHYPPHRHPAEEVYHPLTAGSWRRGAEAWRHVAPGEAIHHPPMIEHETKAGASTLLALYCWIGDTATEAKLST